jgi:hypothetical protein
MDKNVIDKIKFNLAAGETSVDIANLNPQPTSEELELILEVLKQSNIIFSLSIPSAFNSEADFYKVLDAFNEMLSLKKLRLIFGPEVGYGVQFLPHILSKEKLEQLSLSDPKGILSAEDLHRICSALIGNKSITSINISSNNEDSVATILDSLVQRGGIKQLKLPFTFTRPHSLSLVLQSNEISRLRISPLLASFNVQELRSKASLKSLTLKGDGTVHRVEDPYKPRMVFRGLDRDHVFVSYLPDPAFTASSVIESNTTLEEFVLKNVVPRDDEGHRIIERSLKENCTLRHLAVPVCHKIAAKMMFDALKEHHSVTRLDITCNTPHYLKQTIENMPKVLLENWSLRKITILGKEEYIEVTERNKAAQKSVYENAMMAMRIISRALIFERLPIEIWNNIFEYIRHPGVSIEYLEQFVKERQLK